MRIVVTGSEGGIGRYVVAALRDRYPDAEIVRVSRNAAPGSGVVRADLRDHAFVRALLCRTDVVVHAAAAPYGPAAFERPFDTLAHDVDITLGLLQGATENQVGRFVLLSSATVYENASEAPPGYPLAGLLERATESMPMPRSPIALAKAIAESAVRAWSTQTGCAHTIWRLFHVMTPAEPHDRPGHIHVDLFRRIFVDRPREVELAGDGRQLRCFTWVGEVADAIAKYLEDPHAADTFNLGGNEAMTVRELAERMLEVGRACGALPADYTPPVVTAKRWNGDPPRQRMPRVEKVAAWLGWAPRVGADECVERFVRGKLG